MKRTRVLAPCQDTAQSKQRCRTLRTTLDTMISLDADKPSQKRTLTARPTTLATEESLKRSHARLSVWEKDMRRIQAQEAPSDATRRTKQKRYLAIRGLCQTKQCVVGRLLATRMSSNAAANGMNLLQFGAVGLSDSAELRCLPPEIRDLDEPLRSKGRDRRRNRGRNVPLDGSRVYERKSYELG